MSANKPVTEEPWIDPDDAPEWTDEHFRHALHGTTALRTFERQVVNVMLVQIINRLSSCRLQILY